MELPTAQFLVSLRGESAVSEATVLLENKADIVSALTRLRKIYEPAEARAAWIAAQIRSRAATKLGTDAQLLIFDQDGYEMASGISTAEYHADLLVRSGAKSVLDLCTGVGLDTITFARRGLSGTSYESDPGRALLLKTNVERARLEALVKVVNIDVTMADLPIADAAYFDPARRSDVRKWAPDDQTTPSLSFVEHLRSMGISRILAKLSPAIDRSLARVLHADLEFLSVKGECKEALLLMGDLHRGAETTAVLLPKNDRYSGTPLEFDSVVVGEYLWEPDPAVIRAGLTQSLAIALGGGQCDPRVDYFFTNTPGDSPFAQCYRVLDKIPYSRRRLESVLAGVGKVILKQRAFPQSIEEIASRLKLSGQGTAIVVLTVLNGEKLAFLVERVRPMGS